MSVQCDAVTVLALAAIALAAAAPDPTAGMSTRQLAGQHVVSGFSGTTAPKSLRSRIHRGELGGVILFSDNVVGGPLATSALTRASSSGISKGLTK